MIDLLWGTGVLELGASTVRLATPLVFAALGGFLSEKAGIINIALEGKMLIGAFAAAAVAHATGNPWLGLVGGGMAGLLLAAIYANVTIQWKADQIVAGTGLNMLAMGLVPFLAKVFYDVTGSTPPLALDERFHIAPSLLALGLALLLPLWLYKTKSGLWMTFAGEHPQALQAAGVSVRTVRWTAVLAAGFLAGIGGASLSVYLASGYARNMTAGRGFIALAALIFGKWRPIPVVLSCLFFGLTDALQMRLQGVSIAGLGEVPVQFIQILPYAVTLLVLGGLVGRAAAPSALGQVESSQG
jgi:ABC-type uncharacterized transport system permease subunit